MRDIKFMAYDYDNKRFEYDVQYNYDYELGSSFLDILEDIILWLNNTLELMI